MKQIAIISNQDIVPGSPFVDPTNYPYREAVRAILFDRERVLLIHVTSEQFYKLPGGGVEPGETREQALRREVLEETGYTITTIRELGETMEHKDFKPERQRSLCFIANVTGSPIPLQLTEEEQTAGLQAIWVENLRQAIRLMESAMPTSISAQFIRQRELHLLQAAAHYAA